MAAVNPHDSHAIYTKLVMILNRNHETALQTNHNLKTMRENGQANSDKVDYVFKLMEENDLFPDAASLEEEKSDVKSEEFRQEGNFFFNIRKYVDAVKTYNKSMSYAASKAKLSVALANRSAAFLKMEMFSECLESIQLLREVIHPQNLTTKLDEREAKCQEELKKTPKEAVFVPKIGLPVNEKIPFLTKCLELRENKTFGRHIVTTEDIPVGTIIALEEPYCKVLGDPDKYLRCATCMTEVPHRLFPCEGCTQTMFCSKECKEKASADFHAIECPISGSLYKTFDDDLRLVFRMAISAFLAFPDAETMAPALEKIEAEQKNVFSFDWSQQLSPEELYTPMHNLIMNEHHRDDNYLLMKYTMACLMFHFLQRSSPVFSQRYLIDDFGEKILKNILFRHLLTIPMNAGTLTSAIEYKDYFGSDYSEENGGFVGGFISLINHSCSENVNYIQMGTSCAIVTIKDIAAGEQIFNTYGYRFSVMPKTDRQKEIFRKYAFHCKCVACTEDYPMCRNLHQPANVPSLPFSKDVSWICVFPFEYVEKGFQMAKDFIHEYGHLYPISQLCQAEHQLSFCLNIMCGNIPLREREGNRLLGLF